MTQSMEKKNNNNKLAFLDVKVLQQKIKSVKENH